MAEDEVTPEKAAHYWRRNVRLVAILLTIWFLVSFGCGILFVDWLDQFRIPGTGFKLGFWFAQQGSILVFVVLIAVYVVLMNKYDKEVSHAPEDGSDFDI